MLRIPVEEFIDRETETERLYALSRLAKPQPPALQSSQSRRVMNALLLGAPRVGKSELLRHTFDRLFAAAGETVPFYFAFQDIHLNPQRFARLYLRQFLIQFLAFRSQDTDILANVQLRLAALAQRAAANDYGWISDLVNAFYKAEQENDTLIALELALAAPLTAARQTGLSPFVMLDNFHFVADADATVRNELFRAIAVDEHFSLPQANSNGLPVYILSGLRRSLTEMLPADAGIFNRLDVLSLETMPVEQLEQLIRAIALRRGVEISDSTIELMIQQLNGDLFYTRSLIDAAAANGSRLHSFMDFERVYTAEVLYGRIRYYLDARLRNIAPQRGDQRAALELLFMVVAAEKPLPVEIALAQLNEHTDAAEKLLLRLHAHEFLTVNFNFVTAANDPVLADYLRAKYRDEISGAIRPVAGEELLGEKLKHSYQVMMSRYYRSIEVQLIDLLSRFDFQAIPASLFREDLFEKQYRGISRTQTRRLLGEETDKVRLPQIVLVKDIASGEYAGANYRLFTAGGFDGGIYSTANEALWFVALINSREPLDLATMQQIESHFALASSSVLLGNASEAVRWYISKEGFSKETVAELQRLKAHRSTYEQLDLLADYVNTLTTPEAKGRPASAIELIIPIDEEAELIAARTVEQIARAADFDKEAINQIKTALIEACINAAEHGDSPDRKIYQRFAVTDDRLIITVSNKGKAFVDVENHKVASNLAPSLTGTRGRGLKIIRGLMDEVSFEPADDGTTLVMTKLLKRPDKQ